MPPLSDVERVERLRGKLTELRGLQPADDYHLRPCLAESTLRALEREYAIELPAQYALFVTRVGNGGWGPTSYPLHSLATALGLGLSDLSGPFPARGPGLHLFRSPEIPPDTPCGLSQDWLREQALAGDDLRAVVHDETEDADAGYLALGTDGCGLDHILVLDGEGRGEVWLRFDDGLVRLASSLFDWYERALDREIARKRELLRYIEERTRRLLVAESFDELFDCARDIELGTKDYVAAEALFARALERAAKQSFTPSSWHLRWIMECAIKAGKHDTAVELGARTLRDGMTPEALREPIGHSPLGRAHMYRGEEGLALEWLVEPGEDHLGNQARKRAQIQSWARRYEEALATIESFRIRCLEFFEDDDYSFEAELLRGAALAGLRGDERTTQTLLETYEREPGWTADAVGAVRDYIRQRQDLAERVLRRTEQWTPRGVNDAFAYVDDLGLLAQERALAFARCEDVLRAIPDCSSVLYVMASAHLEHRAIEHATACLDRVPDDCAYRHNMYALASEARGDFAQAIVQVNLALARKPGYFVIRDNLGSFLARAGDPVRATELHADVIASEPEYAWAYANMAGSLALQGRSDAALRYLGEALARRYPPWRVAADAALDAIRSDDAYRTLLTRYNRA